MRKLIRKESGDPVVLAWRTKLVRNLPDRNKRKEAQAIYNLARRAIRYTDDPPGTQTLNSAVWTLNELEQGRRTAANCVSQTMLISTLARSLRIPVRLRVLGDLKPRGYYHVHPELWINSKWKSLDVTAHSARDKFIRKMAQMGFKAIGEKEKIINI